MPYAVRRQLLAPLLILLAGGLAYSSSFSGAFVFDDGVSIVQNPGLRTLSGLSLYGRCLVDYSFRLNYAVSGLNAADYHLVNLLFHLGASLLLYGILHRLAQHAARISAGPAHGYALAVATLWTVHPLQTQAVTYLTQRAECMAGFWTLLALYAFVHGCTVQRGARRWMNLCLAANLLGILTKESAVLIPLLVALCDWTFFRGQGPRRRMLYAALLLSWGLFGVLFLSSAAGAASAGHGGLIRIEPWLYFINQPAVILHYLRLVVLPHGQVLDAAWPISHEWQVLVGPFLFLAGLGVFTALALWRRSPAGYALAWFFLTLAPASSIFPLSDLYMEHRMYLPLAGLLALAGCALLRPFPAPPAGTPIFMSLPASRLIGAIPVLLAIHWGMLTHQRNNLYADPAALWRANVTARPEGLRARLALVAALTTQNRLDEAANEAGQLLVRVQRAMGEPDSMTRVSAMRPQLYFDSVCFHIGIIELKRGRLADAQLWFQRAADAAPYDPQPLRALGAIAGLLGEAETAVRHLQAAVALMPDNPGLYAELATALLRSGKHRDARDAFRTSLALNAGLPDARIGLTELLLDASSPETYDVQEAARIAQPLLDDRHLTHHPKIINLRRILKQNIEHQSLSHGQKVEN